MRRLLCVLLVSLLQSCSTPAAESSRVRRAIEDVISFSEPPLPTGDEVRDAFEYTIWAQSLQGYSSYVVHEHRAINILQPIPGEQGLRLAGKEAVPVVLNFLDTRKRPDVVTCRLLGILGASRDSQLLPFISQFLEPSQPFQVRRAAIRAIAELGDSRGGDIALNCLRTGAVPTQDVLWTVLRLGDVDVEDSYVQIMELLLKPALTLPAEVGPRITRPKDHDLGAADDQSSERGFRSEDTIIGDLINLADSRSVRGLGLLIESLRHKDHELQHFAVALLNRVVQGADDISCQGNVAKDFCKSLLDGTEYLLWKSWYDKNSAAIAWSAAAGRFSIRSSGNR